VTTLRIAALIALAGVLVVPVAAAQTPHPPLPSSSTVEGGAWAFGASAYTYLPPDSPNYVQPTVTADRDALHLEARYNYEEMHAISTWLGYNLSAEGTLSLEFTPIVGGVFGSLTGLGLGYEGTLGWKSLELYSEGEWIIDVDASSDSFFYNWSQLTFSPAHWVNFGILTQRTRTYASDREINRGPFLGFTYKNLNLTTFLLNADDLNATVIIGLDVAF